MTTTATSDQPTDRMSADDADAYIDEAIVAFGGPFALHTAVVFVDFHEANVRSGASFVDALNSVALANFDCRVIRARLDAADYIVMLVVERTEADDAARVLIDDSI